MELLAVIEVLKKYGTADAVTIWTDSEYVQKGITQWIQTWKENGWKRRDGSRLVSVKNADLWRELDALAQDHITFRWIKGHSNEEGNERADALAVMASSRGPFIHDRGF